MSERLTVHLNEKPVYDIVLEHSFDRLGEEASPFIEGRRVCIVTDSTVAELYLKEVEAAVAPFCREVISFIFPAGESHKNLDTVKKLYEKLILAKFDRHDVLIALGGGVT